MTSRLLTVILALTATIVCKAASDTAENVLNRAAKDLSSAPSVEVTYTLSGADGASGKGSLVIAGERFHIVMPEVQIWYDGNTQWVYNSDTQEVSITEPTAEELQQINPFVIINRFRSAYQAKLLSDKPTLKKVRLTALSPRADILQADLTLDASYHPVEIDLTLANHSKMTVKITRFTTGKSLPISEFRFDGAKFPSAEVIDLR